MFNPTQLGWKEINIYLLRMFSVSILFDCRVGTVVVLSMRPSYLKTSAVPV